MHDDALCVLTGGAQAYTHVAHVIMDHMCPSTCGCFGGGGADLIVYVVFSSGVCVCVCVCVYVYVCVCVCVCTGEVDDVLDSVCAVLDSRDGHRHGPVVVSA